MQLTIDTLAPTQTLTIDSISQDSGIEGDFVTNDSDGITINATLSAEIGADETLQYSNDNGATWINVTASVSGTAVSIIDATLTSTNTVQFRVTDGAHFGQVASQLVTIDTSAANLPAITITTPIAGDGIVNDAEDNALIISGSTTNVEAGRTVSVVFSDGVNPNVSATAIVGADGTWTIVATDISGLQDGNVTVTASVSDASGNPASAVETVLLDSVAPAQTIIINSISLDSAIDDDFITNDSDGLTITATLSDALDVGEVLQYSNNDGLNWREVLASEMSGNVVTIIDSALTTTNTIQFRVSDGANYGPLASRLVIIDTTAPVTTLDLEEDTGNSTDGITFNGTINLTLAVDVASWEYSTDNGISWTLGFDSSFILPEATYAANAIQVKSFDVAGNSAITSYATAVTVDATAPALTISGDGSAGFLMFTFSEAVSGFDASDIVLMNGTAGAFTQLTTTSYRLNVSPSAGFVAPFTNIAATVNAASYTDIAGNASLTAAENVTSLYDLFASGKVNQNANVTNMDVSHVQDATNAFFYNFDFNQNISTWNTGNITNMMNMFAAAMSFNQNIGNWDTSNVTNMSGMLLGAELFNQNIGAWNTSNVTNMSFMFRYATSFNQNIGTWDTGNVTNMSGMLLGTSAFNQNIGTWNTINVTNMSSMFFWATSFNQNIGTWDTSNVTNMNSMFHNATAFNQNIGTWNTGNVTNMSHMFRDATGFDQSVGTWNTGNVTNMTYMFQNATAFNGNIGAWNTEKVLDMSLMFNGATAFNQNIGAWNTGNVRYMGNMFQNATAFNGDISAWNTINVLDMRYMFSGTSAFNQDIGAWNTGNVMNLSNMFENATAFNADISAWNIINVNDMRYMFAGAAVFNQNIGVWNTTNVLNMSYMFSGATAFNQDIGAWNTANVTSMSRMFNGASAFNQDISNWDVSSLEAGSYSGAAAMLDNSGMSVANFDALLRGWSDIDTSRGETGLNNNIALGAATIQYTDATAFNHLTSVYGWTITSSGLESGVNVGTNVDDTIDASAATSAQKIHALNGSDIVTGSAHDDLIIGGAGNDTLLGGAGSDTFRYYYKTDGNDSIVDFDATNPVGAGQQGDVLDLKTLLDGATQASIANFITLTDAGGDTLRLDIHAVGNPLATADVTVTLNGLSYASAHALGDAVWLDNMITTQHIVL